MNRGILKPAVMLLSLALGAGAAAIDSNDIEVVNAGRSSMEVFSVEIRGPGGQRYTDQNAEGTRHHTIPNSRLHPPRRNGNQGSASAASSGKSGNIGFFTYNKFPADYNVNKTLTTLSLEPRETVFDLAERTKDVKVSKNQQVASIFRKNIKCFNNGSLDSVVPGCIFKIPSASQAAAEDRDLAKKLLAQRGVSRSEFQYALTNCPSGVCGVPLSEGAQTAVSEDKKQDAKPAQPNTITLDKGDKDAGVHYYQGDRKDDTEKEKGREVKPEETVLLIDDRGQKTTIEEINSQSKPDAKTTTSGASLSFSGDTVAGRNSKGEIIDEVSKEVSKEVSRRMDGKFDDINSRIATSNSDISNISREVSELRAQNAALMQQMSRLNDLLEKKENSDQTALKENEIPVGLVAGAGIVILVLLLIITFLSFRMRRKLRSEIESEVDDELEQTGDFDHLMTLDPVAMVPTDGDASVPGETPLSSGIDLNRESDEKPNEKDPANSFIIADDSSGANIDLDEETFQKADIGASDVVAEDPSKREMVDPVQSDDLVPMDLARELDENDFLDSQTKKKTSVDLETNLTSQDIDQIISEAEQNSGNGIIDESSPLAQASGVRNSSSDGRNEQGSNAAGKKSAADEIDAILASMDDSPKVEASMGSEKASEDDIDSIFSNSSLSSSPADEKNASDDDIEAILAAASDGKDQTSSQVKESASEDDIDAILASMGGNVNTMKQENEEKASDDDIDAILASKGGGGDRPDEKASADDIDAILASAGSGKSATDEKASADDIDAILASAGSGKSAADEKPSADDIDAILASAGSDKTDADEKASADDIDAILASLGAGDEKPDAASEKGDKAVAGSAGKNGGKDSGSKGSAKPSDDDIDAILASAADDSSKSSVKSKEDEKISSDDIDDLLNSISSSTESDPVVPAAVTDSEELKVENETVAADDIDALLAQSVSDDPIPEMSDEDAKDNISLAKAYLSIDDKAAARQTLEDVKTRAGSSYREEAEKMLSKL